VSGRPRTLSVEIVTASEEERSALRGALLAAQANELSELRRRGDRLSFGYGSDSARESMSDEVIRRRKRHEMLGRLLAALEAERDAHGD
jgi:hypothetical protein